MIAVTIEVAKAKPKPSQEKPLTKEPKKTKPPAKRELTIFQQISFFLFLVSVFLFFNF